MASAPNGQRVDLPEWLRPFPLLRDEIKRICADPLKNHDAEILIRLATDPRMEKVWTLLSSRKRPRRTDDGRQTPDQNAVFLFPAQQPAYAAVRSPEENQEAAMAETLLFCFNAAKDQVAVKKELDVIQKKHALLERAAGFRKAAQDVPSEAECLHRVARIYETAATEVRPLDDPLTIKNDRGDPITRGVQTVIAAFFTERFGNRLDGTVATLTNVALGLPENARATERASRSAFSGAKRR